MTRRLNETTDKNQPILFPPPPTVLVLEVRVFDQSFNFLSLIDTGLFYGFGRFISVVNGVFVQEHNYRTVSQKHSVDIFFMVACPKSLAPKEEMLPRRQGKTNESHFFLKTTLDSKVENFT